MSTVVVSGCLTDWGENENKHVLSTIGIFLNMVGIPAQTPPPSSPPLEVFVNTFYVLYCRQLIR